MQYVLLFALVACVAARPTNDERIVGGSNANIANYPWQVSLQRNGNHFCGGSILNNNHIMTAAHCHYSSGVSVVMGIDNLNDNGVSRSAATFTIDPNYNSNTNNRDYAVIKTSSTFSYSTKIQAIALASTSPTNYVNGANLITTGWGYISTSGLFNTATDQLQVANVPYVKDCSNYWSTTSYKMCAGGSGSSSCMGDSGGPLIKAVGGSYELVGAVSYGTGTCDVNVPAVYAAIYANRNWIQSQMNT